MQIYVGYGFNTNEINDQTWIKLAEKYDEDACKEIRDELSKEAHDKNKTEELIEKSILEMIEERNFSRADYLKNIINNNEYPKAGDYVVSIYDDFLVFDSIRFADDSKRTLYIRNQEDFIKMIARYIPIDNISFGNLFDGIEWMDPCYFLD